MSLPTLSYKDIHSTFGASGMRDLIHQNGNWFSSDGRLVPASASACRRANIFIPPGYEPYIFDSQPEQDEDAILAELFGAPEEEPLDIGESLRLFAAPRQDLLSEDEIIEQSLEEQIPDGPMNFQMKKQHISPRVLRHGAKGLRKQTNIFGQRNGGRRIGQ